jgi:hypothetical protein
MSPSQHGLMTPNERAFQNGHTEHLLSATATISRYCPVYPRGQHFPWLQEEGDGDVCPGSLLEMVPQSFAPPPALLSPQFSPVSDLLPFA